MGSPDLQVWLWLGVRLLPSLLRAPRREALFLFFLNFLFGGGARGTCDDACDSNDDGSLNVADALLTLNYLFTSGPLPPEPGPSPCGPDLSDDLLGGICSCP